MNMKKGTNVFGLLIIAQSILYGFGDPISKAAYEAMPVYSLLSLRYLIALAVLLIFAGKRIFAGLKRYPLKDALLPSFCIAASYILNNVALGITSATSVAFIRSLSVVMTPLLAWLAYRTKCRRLMVPVWIAIVAGLYLLCGRGGLSGFGLGEVLSLLAALAMAGALVFGGRALEKMDALTLTALQTAASAALATVFAVAWNGGWNLHTATPQIWSIILYLAVGCTIVGYLLQNIALEKLSDRMVALLQCSCPVMTAVFAFLLLGETLSAAGLFGAALILLCVVAATLLDQEKENPIP